MIRFLFLLPFAGAAIAASPLSPATVVREDLGESERALRGGDGRDGREAVQALVAVGSPEAWALIVEALAHEEPQVADQAQIALGELRDAAVLEDLFGKDGLGSKKGIVAERVAEGLGRVPQDLDAAELAKALKAKDPAVRRALAWSIERQALAGRVTGDVETKLLPAVAKLAAKDKDVGVRAAAVVARCALEPADRAAICAEAARNKAAEVRAAAALAATPLENAPRRAVLAPLAQDDARSVRWAVADALAVQPDKDDVGVLVAMLGDEDAVRNAWHLTELLRRMSGLKHRDDPRPWIEWHAGLPDDWEPEDRASEGDYGDRTASLVGLPILSDRVCILIDLSGSTWEERDGKTRKQVLDVELRRALEALPAGTEFNLIPYTDEPHPWKDEVVEASEKNVAKALDWFEGTKHSGKGNFWDAWKLAVSDPRVDTVIALTDGAPTGGTRWNLELMGPLLEEHNRYRRVVLDAIVVDAKGRLLGFWTEMCAATGGRMKSVEL